MFASHASNNKVVELRDEYIVLSSECDIEDWNQASGALAERFDLSYCPYIIILSKRKALAELQSLDNQGRMLADPFVALSKEPVSFISGCQGLIPCQAVIICQEPGGRWVSFFGIPYHLMTYENLDLMCKRFGRVKVSLNLVLS